MTDTHTDFDGRIGPKMKSAVRCVANRVYQSRNQLAITVGPNGSQDYGYRIVRRCRHRGLIEIDPDHPDANPHGRGAVVLTEKGERYAEHIDND